jgi:predicted aminopeptidase
MNRIHSNMRRAALGLVGLLASTACSPTYVLRAGWEEARLLSQRRPIEDVIHDTTVAPAVRGKLRLVEDARDFAVRELGLDAADSFRSYVELSRDTLILAVAAAHEPELRWLTWWFPIVGRVPYRGYFDFDDARAEGDRLADEGFDVSVRPVPAFSTAGWLPDPVVSTTLRSDSLSIATTVIHEITHTTFFAAGRADFNEAFANFVGHRGAIDFFCRAVADERLCDRAQRRWQDTRTFGRFFRSIADPLRELYASDLPDEEKRTRKTRVFQDAARRFEDDVKPELVGGSYGSLDPGRLNNAWVLSRLLYYDRLDDFEAVYEAHDSFPEALQALLAAARQGDPWAALDRLSGARSMAPRTPAAGASTVRSGDH